MIKSILANKKFNPIQKFFRILILVELAMLIVPWFIAPFIEGGEALVMVVVWAAMIAIFPTVAITFFVDLISKEESNDNVTDVNDNDPELK